MNPISEMKLSFWPRDYTRLVSGRACAVEAKEAVKELLEQT